MQICRAIRRRLPDLLAVWIGLLEFSNGAHADSNVEVWSYSYAQQVGVGKAFPLPALPYHFLSGVIFYEDKVVVVSGDRNPNLDDDIEMVGVAYGMAMVNGLAAGPTKPAGLVCDGTGVDLEHAIVVKAMPDAMDEVTGSNVCGINVRGNSSWRSARLLTDGRRYFSVIEYRTSSGSVEQAYVSVTKWAEAFLKQLQ